ncbi:protein GRAVITROPIC IN THE LIGHT 1 [Rhododendron vialii]|uniref:protein GRAVITROPIC IN THE LIGHT 1 n=1 Tax=Rhododendron vialii TaxID=182163 RepID=UPI00265DCF45|nr:protein GRAVITROPIC IN THE LIGHT 1 [Rhododendron vialii]
MDSPLKPSPTPFTKKSKLAKTFQRVIHLNKSTKPLSKNTAFCLQLAPHETKPRPNCFNNTSNSNHDDDGDGEPNSARNRAAAAAFVAKLFAAVSAVKAAYADLQTAQFPYDGGAIQSADEAVVTELRSLSELKQAFFKKRIYSSPPHVTFLLAEIQEQQSLIKMYEVTMRKMRSELDSKESKCSILRKQLDDVVSHNKSVEKKLDYSGQFSILDDIVKLFDAGPGGFTAALRYAVRSVRCFVKVMIREMESSNWDISAAANAVVSKVVFSKGSHRCFAFESFVCREMFDGFDSHDFSLPNEPKDEKRRGFDFGDRFKELKAVNPVRFLKTNPDSGFGNFVRSKYMRLVHPKMETSFSGNLSQRKMINAGEWPETHFFAAFAEMAKRVWLLHCLAFSGDQEVDMFQVRRNCRFSEVYMESVNDDAFAAGEGGDGDVRVAFTVVPGFKIGKAVIQAQVYLLPAVRPDRC